MDYKKLLVGVAVIFLITLAFSGGGLGTDTTTTRENININLDKNQSDKIELGILVSDLNGINYLTKCDTNNCKMILNKKNLFQDKEITFSLTQTCTRFGDANCTKYSVPNCIEWDTNEPKPDSNCLKYDIPVCESWGEKPCLTWTNTTKEEFTKQAIINELSFIAGITEKRKNATTTNADSTGKIEIKKPKQ